MKIMMSTAVNSGLNFDATMRYWPTRQANWNTWNWS